MAEQEDILLVGRQGGHNLPLRVPRSPASRTFLFLCLPTPAPYCVSPVIM